MAAENELMMKTFEGVYLIKIDVDEWSVRIISRSGFKFDGIPIFFKLDKDGKPNGERIDGSAWAENIPKNMAPVMDRFFHGE